jgi:hypothetical protein
LSGESRKLGNWIEGHLSLLGKSRKRHMAWSLGGVNNLNLVGEISCGGKGQGESDSSIFLPISIISLSPSKLMMPCTATSLSFICVIRKQVRCAKQAWNHSLSGACTAPTPHVMHLIVSRKPSSQNSH